MEELLQERKRENNLAMMQMLLCNLQKQLDAADVKIDRGYKKLDLLKDLAFSPKTRMKRQAEQWEFLEKLEEERTTKEAKVEEIEADIRGNLSGQPRQLEGALAKAINE